ncbi:MAG: non-canonical purine NTP pyrophosphatase, partial [Ignavibacteria bacterium]|nr:non-canonical purine NTP pyrophosphatase [Ignavibacteria bacterium]
YDDNNKKLLNKLKGIPKPWKAQFICVINFKDERFDEIFIGTCNGEIVDEPRGKNGFGYDPVFKPNGYDKTFAELEPEEKNKISHRSRALMKFKNFLDENF